MTSLSIGGLVLLPFQLGFSAYLSLYQLYYTIEIYDDFKKYHYIKEADAQVFWYLFLFNFWHFLFSSIVNLTAPIPVLGPILNVLTTIGVWAYQDFESQQTDYNTYYNRD